MLSPITGTRSPNIHHPDLGGSVDQHAAQADVSQIRLERELDDAIRQLDYKAVHAQAAGDAAGAKEYVARMLAAIKSRTPEHVARLEAEALRRVDESTFQGAWTDEIGTRFDVPEAAARRCMGAV